MSEPIKYHKLDMDDAHKAADILIAEALKVKEQRDDALKLLRRAHVEIRRWKSCQSIGACRNCADDGFLLQLGLFIEQHKDRGSPL